MATINVADPIRCALIGYGLAGSVFHAPLLAASAGFRLDAIVTRARQTRALLDFPEVRLFAEPEELWQASPDFDLVVIASPNHTHAPLATIAMRSGLAVVIDKPMATSVTEAQALLETSRHTGQMLTVFQNRRWDGDFLTLMEVVRQGLVGPLIRLESRFERWRPQVNHLAWREGDDPGAAGGLLFDLGSHLIDQCVVLFGKPRRIYSEIHQRRPRARVDDDVFMALEYSDGLRAHLWMSMLARTPGARFQLHGMAGSYEKYGMDPQETALKAGHRPAANWGQEDPSAWGRLRCQRDALAYDGSLETLPGNYPRFYQLLAEAIRNGTPPPVDPADALLTLQIIESARRQPLTNLDGR